MTVSRIIKGRAVIVSDEDAGLLDEKWYLFPRQSSFGGFYAGRTVRGKTFYLHRVLLNPPKGLYVDHIDGNGLNNSRGNLRVATPSQNSANRRCKPPTSGYKGVYAQPYDGAWQAKISVNRKTIRGGTFHDIRAAARKYDEMATKYHGEFAVLNFPSKGMQ